MCSEENMNDYELLTKLSTRHEEVAALLEKAYEQWAELDEQ